ncbi:MAG: LCP family protein [Erysipelotrichaceae bacterium]|nr:LCP family protein [Erysipelotrichaceae bacterium]
MAKKKRRKLRAIKWGALTWLILLVAFLVFAVVVYRFPMIPKKWKLVPIGVVALITAILAFFSFRKKTKGDKSVVSVINTILAVCLIVVSVLLPGISGKIDDIFEDLPETEDMTVNVYALTTQYKSEHSDVFREKGVSMITDPDLTNYKNRQFITQTSVDQVNQNWAIEQIKTFFATDSLWMNETATVWDAVRALYNADGEALILNETYVSTIEENGWESFTEDTIILKSFTRSDESSRSKMKLDTEEPFAVLIAGSDSRDAALTLNTRTDVDIIAVVNPKKRTILLASLPRDSYIANPALSGGLDKLTHMGNSGIDNATAALSGYFGIELNNYVLVNFNTYEKIINTLGGVDIVNPYEFTAGSYTFRGGNIHLSGDEALAYVRERHSLANGDFDRNEHQVIVLKAIIRKLISAEVIANYSAVLDSLSGTFLTNIATESIYDLAAAQLESMSAWTINSRHLDGSTGSAECASAPGQLLSVVYPDESIRSAISEEIKTILEGGSAGN